MNIITLSAIFVLTAAYASAQDYCSICSSHTMCKYQGTGPACEDIGGGGVTEADKRLILDLHNSLRRKIAKGQEASGKGGRQPAAANMVKIEWDDELAKVAQRWADQCTFAHDSCRDVSRWQVGQNLYYSWTIPKTQDVNWTAAIRSWYDEVQLFNPNTVQSFQFRAETGHYTQLVWHRTQYIGCGRRDYGPNKLYACNYGPSGNWIGDPVYEIGAACSRCPEGTVCEDGLCAYKSQQPQPKPFQQYPTTQQRNTVVVRPPVVPQPFQYNKILQSLMPPRKDAFDAYVNYGYIRKDHDVTANKFNLIDESTKAAPENFTIATTTNEVPIESNVIDDLDFIINDDDIKREIEDLKARILELARKIIEKRNSRT